MFNCDILVESQSSDIEHALIAVWTGCALGKKGAKCVVHANNEIIAEYAHATPVAYTPTVSAKYTISIGETRGVNNVSAFRKEKSVRPPWFCQLDKTKMLVLAGGHFSHQVWNELTSPKRHEYAPVFNGTSAWYALNQYKPGSVVTDMPYCARLAIAFGCKTAYVGGPDPREKWWPFFDWPEVNFTWIEIKDMQEYSGKVKRCPCYRTKECHVPDAHLAPTLPCFDRIKQQMSRTHNRIKYWISN